MEHHPRSNRTEYIAYLFPVGYPNSALICGIKNCEKNGLIWINRNEMSDYEEGERIFSGLTSVVKMKADDSGIHKKEMAHRNNGYLSLERETLSRVT